MEVSAQRVEPGGRLGACLGGMRVDAGMRVGKAGAAGKADRGGERDEH